MEATVLGLGLKFLPTPFRSHKQFKTLFHQALNKFHRHIACTMFFSAIPRATNTFVPTDTTRSPFLPTGQPYSNALSSYVRSASEHSTRVFTTHTILRSRMDRRIFHVLAALGANQSIIIKPADKNLGLTLMDKSFYRDMVMTHLADTTTYCRSDRSTALSASIFLRAILQAYRQYFIYSDGIQTSRLTKLARSLLQFANDNCRIAPIYCLPKIHKNANNPPGRPIVSSCSTLTYPTSQFVDNCLRPFLRGLPSVCISSLDAIRQLERITLPVDATICCADVTALYPSIPLDFGLTVVTGYCCQRNLLPPNRLKFILSLMRWVLFNNYLIFDSQVYLQIKGTAMGTPMAPTFASLFLVALETPLLRQLQPSTAIYLRYIDDIFTIMTARAARQFISAFNELCPSIQLEAVTFGDSGVFLDLQLSIETSTVVYSVYQKPANIYQYIPPFSSHPRIVFQSWILEEVVRYRVKSTRTADFNELCRKFSDRLRARGYPPDYLARALVRVPARATLTLKLIQSGNNPSRPNPNPTRPNPNPSNLHNATLSDVSDRGGAGYASGVGSGVSGPSFACPSDCDPDGIPFAALALVTDLDPTPCNPNPSRPSHPHQHLQSGYSGQAHGDDRADTGHVLFGPNSQVRVLHSHPRVPAIDISMLVCSAVSPTQPVCQRLTPGTGTGPDLTLPPPSEHPRRGPLMTLPRVLMLPQPDWRSLLRIPPSVTEHPQYSRMFGSGNIRIRFTHVDNIASFLLRSRFVDA